MEQIDWYKGPAGNCRDAELYIPRELVKAIEFAKERDSVMVREAMAIRGRRLANANLTFNDRRRELHLWLQEILVNCGY